MVLQPPRWLTWILRLLVAVVFIYAGVVKMIDPTRFAVDIDNYRIIAWPIAVRLAFYLPWLEILCGVAVLFWRLQGGATMLLTVLLVIFILATVSAQLRGLDITCGCFGHASKYLSFAGHLAIDFILLAATVFVWLESRKLPLAHREDPAA